MPSRLYPHALPFSSAAHGLSLPSWHVGMSLNMHAGADRGTFEADKNACEIEMSEQATAEHLRALTRQDWRDLILKLP